MSRRTRWPAAPKRRQPPPSLHGERQSVFDGTKQIGQIVKIGGDWKAMATGGIDLGRFAEAILARRAVLARHRSTEPVS